MYRLQVKTYNFDRPGSVSFESSALNIISPNLSGCSCGTLDYFQTYAILLAHIWYSPDGQTLES